MDLLTRRGGAHSYPPELQHIRALFLQNQHRRCITACRDLLTHVDAKLPDQPLRRTFVRFYLALAHDELARTIHNYSKTKVPAIRLAEQLYRDAALSLPTAEQCAAALEHSATDHAPDPRHERRFDSPQPRLSPEHISEGTTSVSSRSPEPLTHVRIRTNSFTPRSPPVDSPIASMSDEDDDLESHASYSQILTPNRIHGKLQRDYSFMSLIRAQESPLPHISSMSSRGGESARQLHRTRGQPRHTKPTTPSKLPRLNTTSLTGSPVRKQLRTSSEQGSPVESPVSPMGSDYIGSDASTISPISPTSPPPVFETVDTTPHEVTPTKLQTIRNHLIGLREHLDRHVQLLEEEEQRVEIAQSQRTTFTLTIADKGEEGIAPLPPSQSFWSFTPTDLKAQERKKRIAAGKERTWQRKRFDPTKYQRLAEEALHEL